MGDILNINGVDICTNILDLDTVLQTNILNVNSVTINCGYSGGSWECSATTVESNSCSGKTLVSYMVGVGSQPTMSAHFSNLLTAQSAVTTDYYYIDYTASTTSTSCLDKSWPPNIDITRQLLGWSIDNNGDALWFSAAGGGIIHTGWSSFITAMNATFIIAVSPTITAPALALIPPFSTHVSSWSAMFKDCECIYDCECIQISGSSGAYSSMTQCNNDADTCCSKCKGYSTIEMAMHDMDCASACIGVCSTYWTEYPAGIPCPMVIGDMLYTDDECTPASTGFYSPNNCDSACPHCYEIGVIPGEIIGVTTCTPEDCNQVVLFVDPWGEPCPPGSLCNDVDCDVCEFTNATFPWTDAPGTPPILQVGHHLYLTDECACDADPVLNPTAGLYRWFDSTTFNYWCIELREIDCKIITKTYCIP